jgi:hypothetical protein
VGGPIFQISMFSVSMASRRRRADIVTARSQGILQGVSAAGCEADVGMTSLVKGRLGVT